MNSIYAVAGQMTLSASNYLVFLIFARMLPSGDFVGFATAVGLNMLAYAIAEGGLSYVAPRHLADRANPTNSAVAGAFITISLVLYLVSLVAGYFLWNGLSKDQLDLPWVLAYAIYFCPAILIPAWVTCWTMDRYSFAALAIVRAGMIFAAFWMPGPQSLAFGGLVFFIFVFCLLGWLNRPQPVVAWANRPALVSAIKQLREVFAAKTMSYTVYSLLPLVVGILRGNAAASNYVTGERLKSLYATVFQPLIQSLYLWQFQAVVDTNRRRLVIFLANLINILTCVGLLIALHFGAAALLGERFSAVTDMPVYVVAAALSVSTTTLLYFVVFHAGDYTVFRRASIVQFIAFAGLFGGLAWVADLSPAWVLCIGEASLLVAVSIQLLLRRVAVPFH